MALLQYVKSLSPRFQNETPKAVHPGPPVAPSPSSFLGNTTVRQQSPNRTSSRMRPARMFRPRTDLRARERQHEDRLRARPLDEVVDEVEESAVRPVEVFEEDRGVRVRVTDSGTGLPASAAPGLFRPFAFTGSAHGRDGFGLSLATAHALATALGGELRLVESGEGQGASLEVRLPLARPRVVA